MLSLPTFPLLSRSRVSAQDEPGPRARFSVGSLPAPNLAFARPSGSLPYHLQASAAVFFLLYVLYRILLQDPVQSATVTA
jgi:hypothetical protein